MLSCISSQIDLDKDGEKEQNIYTQFESILRCNTPNESENTFIHNEQNKRKMSRKQSKR